MLSKLTRVQNATITYVRVVSTAINPKTGNDDPDQVETLEVKAFFHRSTANYSEHRGVPVGSYPVDGYTIGSLPDWCNTQSQTALDCDWIGVGEGLLTIVGEGVVARDLVQKHIKGTPIKGYFVSNGK